jgi:MoaA/NifB/PqqE/SkfB family radical SAM enzyme
MVLTRQNRDEVGAMIDLAASLGSGGVRFGHLMPQSPGARDLELSLAERRAVEQEIWDRRSSARLPVGMAPGYHSASPFFPCGPLELEEFNVDYRGNVTMCCHLSGYGDHLGGQDRAGNLADITLGESLAKLRALIEGYIETKARRVARGELSEHDYSPCLYCVRHFEGSAPRRVVPLMMNPTQT